MWQRQKWIDEVNHLKVNPINESSIHMHSKYDSLCWLTEGVDKIDHKLLFYA